MPEVTTTEYLTTGECSRCRGTFTKDAMRRHLARCGQQGFLECPNDPPLPRNHIYHLQIEGRDRPEYWMNLEVRGSATLELLDTFLRWIWLECCGHLSMFTIGSRRYSSVPLEYGPSRPMEDWMLAQVLRPRMRIAYDFGSTTHLLIRVVEESIGDMEGQSIAILARNIEPDLRCRTCGAPADLICTQCLEDGDAWFCEECAREHPCGEEMCLPRVNSPRVGTCGFTGIPYW